MRIGRWQKDNRDVWCVYLAGNRLASGTKVIVERADGRMTRVELIEPLGRVTGGNIYEVCVFEELTKAERNEVYRMQENSLAD